MAILARHPGAKKIHTLCARISGSVRFAADPQINPISAGELHNVHG